MTNTPHAMSEVDWDDELHYLAEAEQVNHGTVIMLTMTSTGQIKCLKPSPGEIFLFLALPSTLTPTGLKYALTEV